jgi:hypothetical protein
MTFWVEVGVLFAAFLINRLTFIYLFNRKLHLTFSQNPALTFLYFIGMGVGVGFLFPAYTIELFFPHSVTSIIVCLAVLFVVNPWVYDRLEKTDKEPDKLAKANPDQQFLLIEDKYLLSKTGDVIFQQIVAGILILLLAKAGVPFETLVPVFAGIFFLSHLHMFMTTRVIWALYFTIFATLGGFVLPFLVLTVEGGIYYAIAIHMLWYVGSGAFFGFLENDTGLRGAKQALKRV